MQGSTSLKNLIQLLNEKQDILENNLDSKNPMISQERLDRELEQALNETKLDNLHNTSGNVRQLDRVLRDLGHSYRSSAYVFEYNDAANKALTKKDKRKAEKQVEDFKNDLLILKSVVKDDIQRQEINESYELVDDSDIADIFPGSNQPPKREPRQLKSQIRRENNVQENSAPQNEVTVQDPEIQNDIITSMNNHQDNMSLAQEEDFFSSNPQMQPYNSNNQGGNFNNNMQGNFGSQGIPPLYNNNINNQLYDQFGRPISQAHVTYDQYGRPISNPNVLYDQFGRPVRNATFNETTQYNPKVFDPEPHSIHMQYQNGQPYELHNQIPNTSPNLQSFDYQSRLAANPQMIEEMQRHQANHIPNDFLSRTHNHSYDLGSMPKNPSEIDQYGNVKVGLDNFINYDVERAEVAGQNSQMLEGFGDFDPNFIEDSYKMDTDEESEKLLKTFFEIEETKNLLEIAKQKAEEEKIRREEEEAERLRKEEEEEKERLEKEEEEKAEKLRKEEEERNRMLMIQAQLQQSSGKRKKNKKQNPIVPLNPNSNPTVNANLSSSAGLAAANINLSSNAEAGLAATAIDTNIIQYPDGTYGYAPKEPRFNFKWSKRATFISIFVVVTVFITTFFYTDLFISDVKVAQPFYNSIETTNSVSDIYNMSSPITGASYVIEGVTPSAYTAKDYFYVNSLTWDSNPSSTSDFTETSGNQNRIYCFSSNIDWEDFSEMYAAYALEGRYVYIYGTLVDAGQKFPSVANTGEYGLTNCEIRIGMDYGLYNGSMVYDIPVGTFGDRTYYNIADYDYKSVYSVKGARLSAKMKRLAKKYIVSYVSIDIDDRASNTTGLQNITYTFYDGRVTRTFVQQINVI